jgi:outer membrane protein assembly factor BamC
MNRKLVTLILTTSVLLNISGCTYIKSLFPDKEKDYQYTNEIPPLVLPDDLKREQVVTLSPIIEAPVELKNPVQSEGSTSQPKQTSLTNSEGNEPNVKNPLNEKDPAKKLQIVEQEHLFELNTPATIAWRYINKALSKKAIEIIKRNQETQVFTVHYDPEEQKVVDESYWQKAISLFDGLEPKNDIFHIKLHETNLQSTQVFIVDDQDKTLTDPNSIQLLNVIKNTLIEDLSKQ